MGGGLGEGPSDTILRIVDRLQQEEPSHSASLVVDLDRVFRQWERPIRAYCGQQLRGLPAERVEEITQDVLLIAWKQLPGFRGESGFAGWLYGIARNVCANERRRKRELLTDDGVIEREDEVRSVLATLQAHERERVLLDAVEGLDPVDQEVVYARYVLELDRAAIAEELGLPDADAVRVSLQRSRRRLLRILRDRLDELGHGASFVRGTTW